MSLKDKAKKLPKVVNPTLDSINSAGLSYVGSEAFYAPFVIILILPLLLLIGSLGLFTPIVAIAIAGILVTGLMLFTALISGMQNYAFFAMKGKKVSDENDKVAQYEPLTKSGKLISFLGRTLIPIFSPLSKFGMVIMSVFMLYLLLFSLIPVAPIIPIVAMTLALVGGLFSLWQHRKNGVVMSLKNLHRAIEKNETKRPDQKVAKLSFKARVIKFFTINIEGPITSGKSIAWFSKKMNSGFSFIGRSSMGFMGIMMGFMFLNSFLVAQLISIPVIKLIAVAAIAVFPPIVLLALPYVLIGVGLTAALIDGFWNWGMKVDNADEQLDHMGEQIDAFFHDGLKTAAKNLFTKTRAYFKRKKKNKSLLLEIELTPKIKLTAGQKAAKFCKKVNKFGMPMGHSGMIFKGSILMLTAVLVLTGGAASPLLIFVIPIAIVTTLVNLVRYQRLEVPMYDAIAENFGKYIDNRSESKNIRNSNNVMSDKLGPSGPVSSVNDTEEVEKPSSEFDQDLIQPKEIHQQSSQQQFEIDPPIILSK